MEKQNGFIGTCTREEFACGWAWKLRDIHAGSSDCWQNSVLSCGSVILPRLKSNGSRSNDRRDVWVGLKPTARLQTSRGRHRKRPNKEQPKPLLRSERTCLLKKGLTEPT